MTAPALLVPSSDALIRTLEGLDEDLLRAPSLLPAWTRAHVVAHLALNAEGLAGAVGGVSRGEVVPMYRSNDDRNADIAELATAQRSVLLDRLTASRSALDEALAGLDEDRLGTPVPRTPGGLEFPAGAVVSMRWREVEIHHADLDAGYGRADWPDEFVLALLGHVAADRAEHGPFVVRATDLAQEWPVGVDAAPGGPVVSGTGADLGWWLVGRGPGTGLVSEGGPLPDLGRWR